MPTKEKENKVEFLKAKFSKANSIIITDHTGISVIDLTVLRRDLKNSNSEFMVAKNTLLSIAAKESGLAEITDNFNGPTSMVFAFDDPSVPARIIHEFRKETEKPKVKAYVLDNQLLTLDDFSKVALLPPREQVIAMVITAIEGPITGFVMTLEGVIRNFIGLIDSLAEKRK